MSSDEEFSPSISTSRRFKKQKLRKETVVQRPPSDSVVNFSFYSSLKKRSMDFQVLSLDPTMIQQEVRQSDNEKTSPSKMIKEDPDVDQCGFDQYEQKEIEAIRQKAALIAEGTCEVINLDDDTASQNEFLSDTSLNQNSTSNTVSSSTSILSSIQSNVFNCDKYKLFFKFQGQTSSLSVNGTESLSYLLAQTKFDFTSQPRVYRNTKSVYSEDKAVELLPLSAHSKSVKQLGFNEFSIVHCVCFSSDADGNLGCGAISRSGNSGRTALPELCGKVILTFKISEKHQSSYYCLPDEVILRTVNKFERENEHLFDFSKAKYFYDGELIKSTDTAENLELESGDIIDVYLT